MNTLICFSLLVITTLGCSYQPRGDRNDPILLNLSPLASNSADACSCSEISVKFSPNGGAEEAIVLGIDQARSRILLQAYSFTAKNIADALVRAKNRGIHIEVIVDREATGNPHSVVKQLKAALIPIYVDGKHAIAHNKIIIIDDKVIFTGSYNFSQGANLKNAENSLRIVDSGLAKTYSDNWNNHRDHSPLMS